MKKFIKIFLISLLLSSNSYAGSDGELELSKKNRPTKDCFEKINRATFTLNQGFRIKQYLNLLQKDIEKLPFTY
jgi:phospholipid-binding lipoprotein MlaA